MDVRQGLVGSRVRLFSATLGVLQFWRMECTADRRGVFIPLCHRASSIAVCKGEELKK